jgi:predicted CoA-substrate-specific enzyme activase
VDYEATARSCLEQALEQASDEQVAQTVATGYGRRNVPFADRAVTEIHCHGVGCYHHFAQAITVVDIGGQDNKVIRLDSEGRRLDFRMNRKCAAGTGAFIEEIALRLDLELSEMNALAESTSEAVRLSSFCTVFAKTEILSHLRKGLPVSSIVRGAFLSVIQRVVEMDPLAGDVVLTGGVVAYNPVVADILGDRIGREVEVPPDPQFTGALGAALIARKKLLQDIQDMEEKHA